MLKPKSLQDILKQRQQAGFVGREEQVSLFRKNLALPLEEDSRRFIFNICGQGGVGKSTLLRQFRKIAEEAEIICAYSDETQRGVPETMGRLAQQFEQQGHKLSQFYERYQVYSQKRQELESDPEAPKGFSAFLAQTVAKTGVSVARHIVPGGKVVVDLIDEKAVTSQAGEWASFVAKKLTNKDEARLIQEPVGILTPLFLKELGKIAANSGVGLFFDTYERSEEYLDSWLQELLEGRYGEVPLNTIITIAGRQELDKNHWANYEGLIVRLSLEPFTLEEAQQFLARKGITNRKVIDVILSISGRLPLLIATLAAETPNDPSQVSNPSGTAVEHFLKWVEDPKRRQVALNGALSRCLNRDIVAQLEDEEEASRLFDWLKTMPFVEEHSDGWAYHDIVKTQMLRHKRLTSPQNWSDLHGKLADYYDTRKDELQIEEEKAWSDQTWRSHKLNVLYHRLCQAPQRNLPIALNEFLAAFKNKRVFAQSWAEIILQAGKDVDTADVRHWGEQLVEGLKAYEEERYEIAVEIIAKLLSDDTIQAKWRSVAFDWRGYIYYRAKEYSKSLDDLTEAINLVPDEVEYLTDRGKTYLWMKCYDKALEDFNRAIEIDSKAASTLANRGRTYYKLNRYDEALEDFNKAIKINSKYDWALTMRGRTYRSMKRYDDALRDFDRAIEINPNFELALTSRGKTYLLMNHYTKSITDFNLVLELQSDNDWCLYLRGLNYKLLGESDKAQNDFYNAIRISKKNHEKGSNDWYNNFNLALYSLAVGKIAQARKLYQYLANHASSDIIEIAIRNLDDFLIIFPRHMQAVVMRQLLKLAK
ncbi:MAG: tetratricopeptide repeat protein [Cyanomargarita calcarea GSE-NOS-MK-12-04C]|jgi:tetratricopeptide (TPR) repeat protein|uniref:Tetratricopeptide repeat protein n=1 Tax=Cyanomargarita calcarea GSE-NOS-MK-12-04C TaxID=2839659 RepID=A0A951QUQ3_9CYAN|nr:tetratricopeptide repeat protein [Cyanomargarita calcarea GSE-NOS-MK-12-04C]